MIDEKFKKEFKEDMDVVFCKYSISFPFWTVLSERCSFALTESKQIPTAAVDKFGNVLYNCDFVKKIKQEFRSSYFEKLLFITAHEISHFALDFFSRIENRNFQIFNMAHDYAINLLLYYQFDKNIDYLTPSCLFDEKFKNLCAEEIYEIIKNLTVINFQTDILQDSNQISDDKNLIRKRRVELPEKQEDLKDFIQSAINDAYSLSKNQGLLPEEMERIIVRHLRPKVNWLSALRQKLSFGVSRLEKRDTTWQIPNRRFLDQNYIVPSNIGPEAPKIAYAIDTSGSMSQADIDQAIAELEEIRNKFNAKIYFLDCDSEIYNSRWLQCNESMPKLKGGGGTDFRPVFKHLEEKRISPDYCVFFTDGYGEFGNKPKTRYNILWVMTTEVKPPFGELIRVNVPNE